MKALSHVPGKAALGIALLGMLLLAPRAAQAAPPAGDVDKPAAERPMPKHFDELGLTDDQKQQVWDTLDAYNAKIEQINRLMFASRLNGGGFTTPADTEALLKVIRKKRGLALRAILTEEQLTQLDALHAADVAPKP